MKKYDTLVHLFPLNINGDFKFDKEGFKTAIQNACRDMTQRTMKLKIGIQSVSTEQLMNDLCTKPSINSSFYAALDAYFQEHSPLARQEDYDKWHDRACNKVIDVLKDYYRQESITYGKAQKVVNITMKWIFCLDDAERYYDEGYFKYCHMALDSFTLEWIYRKSQIFTRGEGRLIRDNLISWSNMENSSRGQIKSYGEIQELARKICTECIDCKGLTPFEAEFYVWQQMKMTNAAEALYDPRPGDLSKNEFKDKSLKEKIDILKTWLDKTSIERSMI